MAAAGRLFTPASVLDHPLASVVAELRAVLQFSVTKDPREVAHLNLRGRARRERTCGPRTDGCADMSRGWLGRLPGGGQVGSLGGGNRRLASCSLVGIPEEVDDDDERQSKVAEARDA